jgi:hypothetical protein
MEEKETKSGREIATEEFGTAATKLSELLAAQGYEPLQSIFPDSTMRAIIELINKAKNYFAEYSTTLSTGDRSRKIGTGIKNLGFIEASYASAGANPKFLPSYLSLSAFTESNDDFIRKRTLNMVLQQFEKEVSDSMLDAGDIDYRHALDYYNTLKTASHQRIPGAETEFKMLSAYFKKTKPSTSDPTAAEVERDVRSLLHGTKEGRVVIENERPSVSEGKRKIVDEVHSEHLSVRESEDIEGKG